jgi:predicted PurR-regulated permease PerM
MLHESNHPRADGAGPSGERAGHAGSSHAAQAGDGPGQRVAAAPTPPGPAREHPATAGELGSMPADDGGQGVADGRSEAGSPAHPVPYGLAGRPFDRQSPFYFGFLATIGALVAWTLFRMLGQLTTVLTILIVAMFLTLALSPIVEWLIGRGLRRALAVLAVFSGVIVVVFLMGLLVVPPVLTEGSALLGQAPDYFTRLLQAPWVQQLDADFQVIERAQEEFTKRVQDGSLVAQIFGGVLGAGRAVVNGVFQLFTVLILTLYFLASLPRIKQAAYAAVPVSRRLRIVSLSEEIMRRVGAYAAGQALVATVNALCSYVMMTIVGVPYAAVLAVVVGLLGIIPMIGATLGAAVVATIAFFYEPRMALIVVVYYVVYQQFENYVIVPRIMSSTVSVPGAVTIVAALAGGTLLGVVGALLAIPVAAGLLLLYEEVLLPRQRSH